MVNHVWLCSLDQHQLRLGKKSLMTTILRKCCVLIVMIKAADHCSPFSDDSTQECRCGARTCRGVLGPKPSDKEKSKAAKTMATIASALGGVKRKLMGDSSPGSPNKRRKTAPPAPVEQKRITKMDPRTQAAPAVEAPSKHITELQQMSRAMRAEKRAKEEKKSRSGRPLRERHSIHTFPMPAQKVEQVVPAKLQRHSMAASSAVNNVLESAKKSSTIAKSASKQRSSMLNLPKAPTRAVSGSSLTQKLLNNEQGQAGLKQSRSSFAASALSLDKAPESPTKALRQSGRAHKPSSRLLESTEAARSVQIKSSSLADDNVDIKPRQIQSSSRPKSRAASQTAATEKLKATTKSFWDISASEPSDDDRHVDETPEGSPGLRQSKRSHKPSPRMAEIIASGENVMAKRPKSSLSVSLAVSIKNAADATSRNGSVQKVAAMMGSRNEEKAVSKSMRKLSGAA